MCSLDFSLILNQVCELDQIGMEFFRDLIMEFISQLPEEDLGL